MSAEYKSKSGQCYLLELRDKSSLVLFEFCRLHFLHHCQVLIKLDPALKTFLCEVESDFNNYFWLFQQDLPFGTFICDFGKVFTAKGSWTYLQTVRHKLHRQLHRPPYPSIASPRPGWPLVVVARKLRSKCRKTSGNALLKTKPIQIAQHVDISFSTRLMWKVSSSRLKN